MFVTGRPCHSSIGGLSLLLSACLCLQVVQGVDALARSLSISSPLWLVSLVP